MLKKGDLIQVCPIAISDAEPWVLGAIGSELGFGVVLAYEEFPMGDADGGLSDWYKIYFANRNKHQKILVLPRSYLKLVD
tara:strand:+ start:904 stop:1143 length:240 start_codon:yes stop_codon:yes gene_type:complete